MSPSLGAINQNLLMTSNFFLVPTTADFFSLMAIDSLAKILPRWCEWAKMASKHPVLREAAYPFPEFSLRFLGIIVQNYRIIRGKETKAFEKWIQRIEQAVFNKLAPILDKNNVLLPQTVYTSQEINENFTLTKIPNFNSLIALSQEHQTPVFALNSQQLGYTGQVLKDYQKKQEEFTITFSDLADKIIGLTSVYAVSA